MKKIKIVAFIVLIAFSTSLLSGCFKKEQKKTTKNSNQKVQLVYYKLYDDEDVMKGLISQYDSNVSIVYRKFTDPKEYENLIINELAEGKGPDIFSMPNYWFLKNQKKISPLPNETVSVKQFEDTFVSVAKDDLVLTDPTDGKEKIYGLPLTVDTLALYYNKATYDDKIPSRGKPASTWDELKDDVYKLSKKDNSFERFDVAGISMGRSDNISRAIDVLYLLMLQYKTVFYNENVSAATFSKQTSVSASGTSINPATTALKDYVSYALPTNKNYSWNAYLADSKSSTKEVETFARGKVAMIFGYSYLYDQIAAEIKDLQSKGAKTIDIKNVKVAAVPQVINPDKSTEKRVAYANYYAETVARTTENEDVAWDFLMFLASKENMQYYNQKTHKPTSRRDMINDQVQDPIYGVFADQIGYAESFPIYDSANYYDIFSDAINSVLATGSPTEAIKNAEQKISDMLPAGGLIAPAAKNTAKQEQTNSKTTQQSNKK